MYENECFKIGAQADRTDNKADTSTFHINRKLT